jgi:hypothetical protein
MDALARPRIGAGGRGARQDGAAAAAVDAGAGVVAVLIVATIARPAALPCSVL